MRITRDTLQDQLARYKLTGLRYRTTQRLAHRLLDDRPTDRYIVAHPRSGSTWLRTILSNIVFPDQPSNPDVYNAYMPSVTLRSVPTLRKLPAPRLMVSHTNYLAGLPCVVYIVRDGRDAIVSSFHYWITRRQRDTVRDFGEFLQRYLLGSYGPLWHADVHGWLTAGKAELGERLLVMRFEDMKARPIEMVSQIATFLQIAHTAEQVQMAVQGASIETMRQVEQRRQEYDPNQADTSFYRGGKTGQWRDYFSPPLERAFCAVAADAMHLAGYRCDGGLS
ncbi:MAG: sulfotransferase domain-containing protein [Chloroflexaceae bacterium]|nr:sulfotransferase domain-containing protein [Chloroflexaceae bacterium]NJO06630.1 sulfotransferase domain-containing protein [Chloroflexaceae bacterium]